MRRTFFHRRDVTDNEHDCSADWDAKGYAEFVVEICIAHIVAESTVIRELECFCLYTKLIEFRNKLWPNTAGVIEISNVYCEYRQRKSNGSIKLCSLSDIHRHCATADIIIFLMNWLIYWLRYVAVDSQCSNLTLPLLSLAKIDNRRNKRNFLSKQRDKNSKYLTEHRISVVRHKSSSQSTRLPKAQAPFCKPIVHNVGLIVHESASQIVGDDNCSDGS